MFKSRLAFIGHPTINAFHNVIACSQCMNDRLLIKYRWRSSSLFIRSLRSRGFNSWSHEFDSGHSKKNDKKKIFFFWIQDFFSEVIEETIW